MELFRNFKYRGEIHRYPDLIWIAGAKGGRQKTADFSIFGCTGIVSLWKTTDVFKQNHLTLHQVGKPFRLFSQFGGSFLIQLFLRRFRIVDAIVDRTEQFRPVGTEGNGALSDCDIKDFRRQCFIRRQGYRDKLRYVRFDFGSRCPPALKILRSGIDCGRIDLGSFEPLFDLFGNRGDIGVTRFLGITDQQTLSSDQKSHIGICSFRSSCDCRFYFQHRLVIGECIK